MYRPRWTDRDDEVLRKGWASMSLKELGSRLGRQPDAISRRAMKLGLPKKDDGVRRNKTVREEEA
jgi:hypothetical protein